jgi:hypothetical protein
MKLDIMEVNQQVEYEMDMGEISRWKYEMDIIGQSAGGNMKLTDY